MPDPDPETPVIPTADITIRDGKEILLFTDSEYFRSFSDKK